MKWMQGAKDVYGIDIDYIGMYAALLVLLGFMNLTTSAARLKLE